jgi:hypothetical protein
MVGEDGPQSERPTSFLPLPFPDKPHTSPDPCGRLSFLVPEMVAMTPALNAAEL